MDPPYPGTMNKYDQFYGLFDEMFNIKIWLCQFFIK
jgi:adenine-specific DNA-methyltransferase